MQHQECRTILFSISVCISHYGKLCHRWLCSKELLCGNRKVGKRRNTTFDGIQTLKPITRCSLCKTTFYHTPAQLSGRQRKSMEKWEIRNPLPKKHSKQYYTGLVTKIYMYDYVGDTYPMQNFATPPNIQNCIK